MASDLGTIEDKMEPDSLVVTNSFKFEGIMSIAANGILKELDLSIVVLVLEFIPTLQLFSTTGLGSIEVTFDNDSTSVTPHFRFDGNALLGKNGIPQELD